MKIEKITIKNYKSIKEVSFVMDNDLKEQTYTLIGNNESGKSSFLEAINYFDQDEIILEKFYQDKNNPIEIILEYSMKDEELKDFISKIKEKYPDINDRDLNTLKIQSINIKKEFYLNSKGVIVENIIFNKTDFKFNKTVTNQETGESSVIEEVLNIEDFYQTNFKNYFYKLTHYIIFWKSEEKYLIDKQIDLNLFKEDIEISVPLRNCFNIIGIKNDQIKNNIESVVKIENPRDRKNLTDKLDDEVSKHINNIWKEHKIKIKFEINGNLLSFLIEDEGVKFDNKETSQRSDGFRQFVSFLLSVSAENMTGELSNSLLLIDEPEQHLHPTACESLKDELIKITNNQNNNVVFFSSHSVFMIDQQNLNRTYNVYKDGNKETKLEKNIGTTNTYASVLFKVFGLYTNDYHNELYGDIMELKQEFVIDNFDKFLLQENVPILKNNNKDVEYINDKTSAKNKYSVSTYIRNQIHHPENKKNKYKFTKEDLKESINKLIEIKNKLESLVQTSTNQP